MADLNLILISAPTTTNFIVKIILWLVQISSSVVLGIILFTVLLKLITLPFDFVSRASMRKNSLKMEEMRPELEKLQKQYANDKNLYNQKMMALYKKNGYSMWGSCLPTIITLVVFIIAINGFQDYSKIQNKQYFYDMSLAYNQVIYDEFIGEDDKIVIDGIEYYSTSDGKFVSNDAKLLEKLGENNEVVITDQENIEKYLTITKTTENNLDYITVNYSLNDSVSYIRYYTADSFNTMLFKAKDEGAKDVIINKAQEASANSFKDADKKFLWVQNVWEKDSMTAHPVKPEYTSQNKDNGFKESYGELGIGESDYESLTAHLTKEKTEIKNGYYILVLLTALTSLALQLISSKSQKAQMELQTVDGQGAQTNKMMMWMMPIMMAVFAFMYTAAFCIYIVLSSLISMLTTVLINYFVDKKFKKENYNPNKNIVRGRVYTPKEEPIQEKPVKKTKLQKEIEADGFLSGKNDKKSPKKR